MTTGPIPEVFDRARLLAFLEEYLNLTGSGDCCDEKGPDGALRYNNDGTLTGSAKVRFDGTDLIADSFKVSDLTPTRLIVAGSSGHLEDNAALTFDGTRLDTPILSASSTIFTSQVTASEGAYFADRVGIGTATPKMSLEILDPTGQIRLSENDTDNATLSHRLGKFTISVCGGGGDPMVVQAGAVGVVDGGNDLTPTAMFHASSSYDNVSLLRLDSAASGSILFVSGSGRVGIGTSTPEAYLEVTDGTNTFSFDRAGLNQVSTPTALSNDTGAGTVVTFGSEEAPPDELAAGKLMVLDTAGSWRAACANAGSIKGTSGLLAIALGSTPADGLLINGFFNAETGLDSADAAGVTVYISETTGTMTTTKPNDTGDLIRAIGYVTDSSNSTIYFSPSNTYDLSS